jgi:serine/threonine protein kinase
MSEGINVLDDLDFELPLSELGAGPSAARHAGAGVGGFEGGFFGPYQLLQEVGKGGVASVHRARHIHPQYADRQLALKLLHESLSRDPMVVSLFRREAYVLSLLKHPSIVQTFEAGEQEGRLFIAMEYVDGRDLDAFLFRCHHAKVTVPLPILTHIAGELLSALIYAHNLHDNDQRILHLVHRDINPANVFLSYNGQVKLGDFGVASITAGRVEKSRELAGKIGYFAPEQIDGGVVDGRADLFALGAMLFEMICGVRLFDADDADKAMRLNRKAKIPKLSKLKPDLPPELERIILKALEKRPQDRFASGTDMLTALEPFLPPPQNMRMATASLMRTLFLREHLQEVQLRDSLSGRRRPLVRGQLVDIVTSDTHASAAFAELLTGHNYRVRTHDNLVSLTTVIIAELPHAILVDVEQPNFSAAEFNAAIQRTKRVIPIIASCANLDSVAIERAMGIHAGDLLSKPLYTDRVLASLSGAATFERPKPFMRIDQKVGRLRTRVLIVSADAALRQQIKDELSAASMVVEDVEGGNAALMRFEQTSYHAVIYDANPVGADAAAFAGQLRAAPGIGLLPLLYLADAADQGPLAAMPYARVGVTARAVPALAALNEAMQVRTEGYGRLYTRHAVSLAAEIRYGGRLSTARAVDLSRGGVLLQCAQIPPLGTQVGVMLRFGDQAAAQVAGRVIRVGLVSVGTEEMAQVGPEFDTFAGQDEAQLIAYIRSLVPTGAVPVSAAV